MITWKITLSERTPMNGSTEFTCSVTNCQGTRHTGKGNSPAAAYRMACERFIYKPWLINLEDASLQANGGREART